MFDFHKDKKAYFDIQYKDARDHLVPFISKTHQINNNTKVLEIGSGEGGVMKAFLEYGCNVTGVEILEQKVQIAREYLKSFVSSKQAKLISADIFKTDLKERFDIIILKDVVEHISDKDKLFVAIKGLLKPDGVVFVGFPPWQMPFGGHQQGCEGKVISKVPYFHLLPTFLYRFVLKLFGESDAKVEALMDIKDSRTSIEYFEKIIELCGYNIAQKKFFLITPIYTYKFGLKPVQQFSVLSQIPYLRNFFTTGVYYLLKLKG